MCGIAIVHSRYKTYRVGEIAKSLLTEIRHRGPDEYGIIKDLQNDCLAIGANRLGIIGRQSSNITPFFKKGDRFTLAYNGEIYNYKEIRDELVKYSGSRFETQTDTEVVYEAWKVFGAQSLKKFNGMFSIAIFDEESGKLHLARDISGQKPLYLYKGKDLLAIASEAKAFTKLPVRLELVEEDDRDFYEAFQHTFTQTLYKGVTQVRPATHVEINLTDYSLVENEYWTPSYEAYSGTFSNAVDDLHRKLEQAVQRHKISEVKYGLYLSDGLDSNILQVIGKFENTYTYTSSEQSESELYDTLPRISRALDFPIASLSSFPLYKLASEAKEDDCTVVVSGEGADEIFGGYVRYLMPYQLNLLFESKPNYKPLFTKAVPEPSNCFSLITNRGKSPDYVISLFRQILGQSPDFLTAMQYFDFKYVMPSLLTMGDRMSSQFSLENRCPYLDKEIIEFAFSLPQHYKISYDTQKKVLVELGLRLGYKPKHQKTGLTIDFNNYLHRNDWDRSSYFSILNYLWISSYNDYKLSRITHDF